MGPDTRRAWRDVAGSLFRLGATSYGGPAIIGIMQAELQERRKWVSKERFLEGLSVANMLPGSTATQLGVFLGYARGGWWGGLIGGLCFVAPAFFVMLALTVAYASLGFTPIARGALYGLGPVVISLVARRLMRHPLKQAILVFGLAVIAGTPALALAAEPDWKAVEAALSKSGQMQPGGVFRIGMPRTDLTVTVKGVPVKAGFALGSYAAFKPVGDQAMVMGDLVLLDQEVPAVMAGLFRGGLEVTAVHNHLNDMSPHVMYMHYEGHGNLVKLATALRQALSVSGTPLGGGGSATAVPAAGPGLDTRQIEQALGRSGRTLDGGLFQVTVSRAEVITEMGVELLPAMGVTTVLNFQPTTDGKAAITGDFVLIDKEVNTVARTLTQHGIDVTAIHNHGLMDTPRLFYMHFWANDDPVKLAQALKAALAQTNSAKP